VKAAQSRLASVASENCLWLLPAARQDYSTAAPDEFGVPRMLTWAKKGGEDKGRDHHIGLTDGLQRSLIWGKCRMQPTSTRRGTSGSRTNRQDTSICASQ